MVSKFLNYYIDKNILLIQDLKLIKNKQIFLFLFYWWRFLLSRNHN